LIAKAFPVFATKSDGKLLLSSNQLNFPAFHHHTMALFWFVAPDTNTWILLVSELFA
jgi:hypothetical protein